MTRILLRRWHALGDTLSSTPIARRLRKENPGATIDIHTQCVAAYQGNGWKNPDIDSVGCNGNYDRVIDLDMAHETRRKMHWADAYMEVAFGDHYGDKEIIFPLGPPPIDSINTPENKLDWSKVITIHSNNSWASRTMAPEWWHEVCLSLTQCGYRIMALGTGGDPSIDGIPGLIDTRDRFDLWRQARAIHASAAFLCGASGLFILAGATETPIIVPLTICRAEHCLPYRHGELGWNCYPLITDLSCYGCNQEYGAVTYVGCLRNDYACIANLRSRYREAVETVLRAIRENKRAQFTSLPWK